MDTAVQHHSQRTRPRACPHALPFLTCSHLGGGSSTPADRASQVQRLLETLLKEGTEAFPKVGEGRGGCWSHPSPGDLQAASPLPPAPETVLGLDGEAGPAAEVDH